MTKYAVGQYTYEAIGLVLREIVRRAIVIIRSERFTFSSKAKKFMNGKSGDFVTSADNAAQKLYVSLLSVCFPGIGIVAEEGGLSTRSNKEFKDVYFTVDPLDGTFAFRRKQSEGIGTMISLVKGTQVIAAYIGDVMTGEIYGYSGQGPQRIVENFHEEALPSAGHANSDEPKLLLIEDPSEYSNAGRRLIKEFPGYRVDQGSMGLSLARLWKGEVQAVLITRYHITPWDYAPIYGISEKLGYKFVDSRTLRNCESIICREVQGPKYEILVW